MCFDWGSNKFSFTESLTASTIAANARAIRNPTAPVAISCLIRLRETLMSFVRGLSDISLTSSKQAEKGPCFPGAEASSYRAVHKGFIAFSMAIQCDKKEE